MSYEISALMNLTVNHLIKAPCDLQLCSRGSGSNFCGPWIRQNRGKNHRIKIIAHLKHDIHQVLETLTNIKASIVFISFIFA